MLTLEPSHIVAIAGIYALLTVGAVQLGRTRGAQVAWRVDEVERRLEDLPTRREVAALIEAGVGGIRGEVHGLAASVRRMEGMLNVLIEHHLDGDKA